MADADRIAAALRYQQDQAMPSPLAAAIQSPEYIGGALRDPQFYGDIGRRLSGLLKGGLQDILPTGAGPIMAKQGYEADPNYMQKMTDAGFAGMTSQAKIGGQIADSNGYFYKGGQFLPSTAAEPGKWKVDGKWVTTGKRLVEPGTFEVQPTPFSWPIFPMLNPYLNKTPEGFKFRDDIKAFGDGSPFDVNAMVRPGVKGAQGKEEISLQELLDAYNKGQRWFDVKPNAETITTLVAP
jgi:hypothetical protein